MAGHGPLDKKQIVILQALWYLTREQQCAVLRTADRPLVRLICECYLNVLRGNVRLDTRAKLRLRSYAALLRQLAASLSSSSSARSVKKNNWLARRRLLASKRCREGGFLPRLLSPVLRYINHHHHHHGAC